MEFIMTEATARPINPKHEEWMIERGIDPELAVGRFGLYSARRVFPGDGEPEGTWKEPEPSRFGNVLVFPYYDRGKEVNAKFRAPGKAFFQRPGSPKTFWNAEVLDDPDLLAGNAALVITEGEPDALIAIQDGHPWTVSCPDGAPADVDARGNPIPMRPEDEIDPEHDPKYEFVFNNWERLGKIKRIILATDGDGPGRRLREELARRLGKVRCAYIDYPLDPVVRDGERMRPCKDLNEVHQAFGPAKVRELLNRPRLYPVAGLYKLSDYEDRRRVTYNTGFDPLDDYMRLYESAFVVVTGTPGSGKSAFVNQIGFNMAALHGWPVGIATFEAPVKPDIRDQFTGFLTGKARREWTLEDRREGDEFINQNLCFITNEAQGHTAETELATADVDWVMDRAADAVIRYGIKLLILDPWNELEHQRRPGETIAEYTNRAIRTVKAFCRRWGVCTIVVTHPTKASGRQHESAEDGPMTLYDISDGATWANKAELGLAVHREHGPMSTIAIRKVKFWDTGKIGQVLLPFDEDRRQFLS
jgi:twinkle protein